MLKNPSHLFALDALLAVYPDALVIQTHRDPAHGDRVGLQPGRAGVGGLVHHVHRRGHRPGPARAVGVRVSSGSRPMRARHDPAQFFDVSYDDLAADPVGTAEAAYAYFGLPFSGAAADAMRGLPRRRGRSRSAHRYALADFGLTAADVDARFGALSHGAAELR